jgi:SAM-dependent methyltransferase
MLFQWVLLAGQLILLCAAIAFIFHHAIGTITPRMNAPYVPTDYELLPTIESALDIRPGDIVYDLGCGDGRLLFYCAEKYPDTRFVGIEHDWYLVLFMWIRILFERRKNIKIHLGNIFTSDFSDATRIYTYLLPGAMSKLEPKLMDVRLVSRAFRMHKRQPARTIEMFPVVGSWGQHLLYIYET